MERNIEIDIVVEAKCIATERQEWGKNQRGIRNWAESWESRVTRTRGRPLGSRGPEAQSPARPLGSGWAQAAVYARGCTQVREEATDPNPVTRHDVLFPCDSAAWLISGIKFLIENLNCKLPDAQEPGSLDPMQISIAYEMD